MLKGTLDHYAVSPQPKRYTMLDLFAGAGGLSLGLTWAGFRSVGAVEFDSAAAETYESNFGAHLHRDADGVPLTIEEVDFSRYKGEIDLLVGGPPCQGFSQLGKGLADDPRNRLWREFMVAVETVRPRAFLMENVPPILRAEEGEATREVAEKLGYDVAAGVLNANEFGVPQVRRRAFILGTLEGQASLPSVERNDAPRTVRWAIDDLPLEPDEKNWHKARNPRPMSIERYKVVPEGGNRFDLQKARPDITPRCWLEKPTGSTDVFGRLSWDKPALTIRTEFFKPEKGRYLHPQAHRPITHREAARLQTFPDDFEFCGSNIEVAKQIGNAVPPLLAYRLGRHIATFLKSTAQIEPEESGRPITEQAASTLASGSVH